MYLMAGLSSFFIVAAVLATALLPGRLHDWRALRGPATSVLGLHALLNFLYFNNLIRPFPLAMTSAGIYHSVVHMAGGTR